MFLHSLLSKQSRFHLGRFKKDGKTGQQIELHKILTCKTIADVKKKMTNAKSRPTQVGNFKGQCYWSGFVDLPHPIEWPKGPGYHVDDWARKKQRSILCRAGKGLNVVVCHVDATRHIWNSIMVLEGEKHVYLFNGAKNPDEDEQLCDCVNSALRFTDEIDLPESDDDNNNNKDNDVINDDTEYGDSKISIPFPKNPKTKRPPDVHRFICTNLAKHGLRHKKEFHQIILKPGDVLWMKETVPHLAINIPNKPNQKQLALITTIYMTNRLHEHLQEILRLQDMDDYKLARNELRFHYNDIELVFKQKKNVSALKLLYKIIETESLPGKL